MKRTFLTSLGQGILALAVACGSRPSPDRPCEGGNLVESGGWEIKASGDGGGVVLNIFERHNSPIYWEWIVAGKTLVYINLYHQERPWMMILIEGGMAKADDGILQDGEWERVNAVLSSDPGWYYFLDILDKYAYESVPEFLPIEVCRDSEGNVSWRVEKPEKVSPSGSKER